MVPYVVSAVVAACNVVCAACVCAARVTAMLVWDPGGGVVVVSSYMGGTCSSGVLCNTGDVLEMSVVRGVGGVCHVYVFGSWRCGRCWGRVGELIGFGFYQSYRNRGRMGYVSLLWLRWCWGKWVGGLSRRVGWC